ncbi:hypothetical protein ACTWP5_05260 [Streptomyces sp. 4N509B]|uniref:hypothetical protein n=1 Tax=Streptomyces sp. 4N509B TaxID=3457413 RepID=UPI003FD42A33
MHFDAVRVCHRVGTLALRSLAGRSGPVIDDRRDGVLFWLVPVGSADGWCLRSVSVYGVACYVGMPPLDTGHARWVEWLIQPEPGWDGLTDPEMLHDALTAAVAALCGPRPESGR